MGKKKAKRTSRRSSGKRKAHRLRRMIRKTKQKISRWERYSQEERSAKDPSRATWNTSGLTSHLHNLEKHLKSC